MTPAPRQDLLLARSKRLTRLRRVLLSFIVGLVPLITPMGGADAATTNLLSANQQSIESSTAGWQGQLSTKLSRRTLAYDGTYSLLLRATTSSAAA